MAPPSAIQQPASLCWQLCRFFYRQWRSPLLYTTAVYIFMPLLCPWLGTMPGDSKSSVDLEFPDNAAVPSRSRQAISSGIGVPGGNQRSCCTKKAIFYAGALTLSKTALKSASPSPFACACTPTLPSLSPTSRIHIRRHIHRHIWDILCAAGATLPRSYDNQCLPAKSAHCRPSAGLTTICHRLTRPFDMQSTVLPCRSRTLPYMTYSIACCGLHLSLYRCPPAPIQAFSTSGVMVMPLRPLALELPSLY